ncbi:MAG: MotA/TolQ/ExbB proton channel family protein, partial [Gemmatimonadota bacterium]
MDIATLVGLLAGAALVILGIGQPELLLPPLLSLFVIGGGLAVVLLAHPLRDALRLPAVLLRAVFARPHNPGELVERLVYFSETARREGILALEKQLTTSDPPLLQAGTRLAVDGTEPDLIMDILETELRFVEERHARGRRLLHDFGLGLALFGLLGALTAVWQGAEARLVVLPLLYGCTLGGLVCWPLSRKLGENHEREALTWRMTIEGIMSIQSGDNPRIVEHKLAIFLEAAMRPHAAPQPAPLPPPGPDDTAEQVAQFVERQRPRLA